MNRQITSVDKAFPCRVGATSTARAAGATYRTEAGHVEGSVNDLGGLRQIHDRFSSIHATGRKDPTQFSYDDHHTTTECTAIWFNLPLAVGLAA
ncbi:hypothetical protein MTO96_024056 [Rhipicephalus appendiculatus]